MRKRKEFVLGRIRVSPILPSILSDNSYRYMLSTFEFLSIAITIISLYQYDKSREDKTKSSDDYYL